MATRCFYRNNLHCFSMFKSSMRYNHKLNVYRQSVLNFTNLNSNRENGLFFHQNRYFPSKTDVVEKKSEAIDINGLGLNDYLAELMQNWVENGKHESLSQDIISFITQVGKFKEMMDDANVERTEILNTFEEMYNTYISLYGDLYKQIYIEFNDGEDMKSEFESGFFNIYSYPLIRECFKDALKTVSNDAYNHFGSKQYTDFPPKDEELSLATMEKLKEAFKTVDRTHFIWSLHSLMNE